MSRWSLCQNCALRTQCCDSDDGVSSCEDYEDENDPITDDDLYFDLHEEDDPFW